MAYIRRMILIAVLAVAGGNSYAGPIGITDFGGAAQVTDFNGLGLPLFSNPIPLVIDGHVLTTDSGAFRYGSAGCSSGSECIFTETDLGFIDVVLDTTYEKAGAFAFAIGFGGSPHLRAEFFDPFDVLLGSIDLLDFSAGPSFAGWQDPGGIARVRFTDLGATFTTFAFDDLTVESDTGGGGTVPVPEPGVLCLLGAGALAIGLARRRRPD